MFKKDDKVKVIKGIKAFEGLTGTVLDTNGSQVKVKLNMSEDAEVQKNIINVFEDYQLELESLDLLKEEAEATFDDEEDDEDKPEPTEEAKKELAEYKQMVQDAIKSRKPVKCDPFKVYFKDMNSYNPKIKYEGIVWYENGYHQSWDVPEWDCYDDTTYTIELDFEELMDIALRYAYPLDCLKEANIYWDPYNEDKFRPEEILYVLKHLDDEVYDRLDKKAQQEYDEAHERDYYDYYDESLDSLKEDKVSFDNDAKYPNPSFTSVVEDSWNHLAYDLGKDPVLLSDLVNDIQGNYEGYEDVSDTEIKEILHRGNWDYVDDLTDDYEPEIKGTLEEDYTTNIEAAEQAIKLYRTEPNVKGVFFGVDTKDGFVSYVKTYHNDAELQEINNQIDKSFPNHWTVWAAHSDYAINEIERQLKNKLNKKNESLKLTESDNEKYVIIKPFTGNYYDNKNGVYVADLNKATTYDSREEALRVADSLRTRHESSRRRINSQGGNDIGKLYLRVVKRKFKDENTTNESLKLTEEELKNWCSDNDANYYTQDIKDDKVIIRGLKEDLAEYNFKTKELKVFDYSGTTTQDQDLEDDYDDNYIRDYVYDVDMLDDEEYPSWEFVSVIATAENISDDSVIQEAHDRGFKVFLIQASNYEKFVVAAEKITEEDIMEDFASYLEGNPKVTEII